jgi:hypothetical protein
MKKFIVKNVGEICTEEIDFKFYNDLFGEETVQEMYDGDEHPSDFIIDDSSIDIHLMSIEYLESIIAELKAKGANYVAIDYNCDHPDYTIHGCSVQEASSETIQEAKEIELREQAKAKEAKRAYLLKQLEDLDKA